MGEMRGPIGERHGSDMCDPIGDRHGRDAWSNRREAWE